MSDDNITMPATRKLISVNVEPASLAGYCFFINSSKEPSPWSRDRLQSLAWKSISATPCELLSTWYIILFISPCHNSVPCLYKTHNKESYVDGSR